jgi:hypothetical protein
MWAVIQPYTRQAGLDLVDRAMELGMRVLEM